LGFAGFRIKRKEDIKVYTLKVNGEYSQKWILAKG
jgi:hypothetical protein